MHEASVGWGGLALRVQGEVLHNIGANAVGKKGHKQTTSQTMRHQPRNWGVSCAIEGLREKSIAGLLLKPPKGGTANIQITEYRSQLHGITEANEEVTTSPAAWETETTQSTWRGDASNRPGV